MDTASQLKQLLNNGVGYANDVPCTSQATIIVVGAPRSGTSMIAAALDALGIYMGDNKDDAVFEDRRIAHGLEKDPSKLPGIIADYNAHHSIWGFKRPTAFETISDKINLFRNPRFIIPFRDPMAIAKRKQVSINADAIRQLRNAADITLRLTKFVQELQAPVMMLSYEKAIMAPKRTLLNIALFSGLSPETAGTLPASKILKNGPDKYVLASQRRFPKST